MGSENKTASGVPCNRLVDVGYAGEWESGARFAHDFVRRVGYFTSHPYCEKAGVTLILIPNGCPKRVLSEKGGCGGSKYLCPRDQIYCIL